MLDQDLFHGLELSSTDQSWQKQLFLEMKVEFEITCKNTFHLGYKMINRVEPAGTCSKSTLSEHERRVMFP